MIEIVKVRTSDVVPYENNPRKNKKAVEEVAKSIKEFGFLNPIILDNKNRIVSGHTRIEAAIKLGLQEVPAVYIENLTEDQIKAFRIMDNKSSEYATWDQDRLREELKVLEEHGYKLDFTGFTESELSRLVGQKEEMPQAGKTAKYEIKEGEVYILGNHRLICGDSTKPETFKKLMKDEKAELVFTDPPYGVSYSGTNNPNGRDWSIIKGDELRNDELYSLLHESFENVLYNTTDNPAIFVFHSSSNQIIFEKALNANQFEVKQQIIWDKHHVLGRSHYHWTHEPIFYAAKKGKTPFFYGARVDKTVWEKKDPKDMTEDEMRDYIRTSQEESTIWRIKKDNAMDYIHPTQKPMELAERAIINHTKVGQIVLDPFAGSGSTLLACEKRKRNARVIELDPTFCSHIIERWEEYSKLKHQKEEQ